MAAAAYFVGATVLTCSLAYNIAINVGFCKDNPGMSNQKKIIHISGPIINAVGFMLLGCFVGTIVSAIAYQAILSNVILSTALLVDAFLLAAMALKKEKAALENTGRVF